MTALYSVCMSRSVPGELRKDSHFKIYSVKKRGIQRDEEEEKPAGGKHKLQQQPTNEHMMCRNIEHSLLVLNYRPIMFVIKVKYLYCLLLQIIHLLSLLGCDHIYCFYFVTFSLCGFCLRFRFG